MRAGIYFNKHYIKDNKIYLDKIQSILAKSHIECITIENLSDLSGLDVLFVLGGDGTILMVASECAKYNVKIIGINYGHVGFLTEYDRENIDDAVNLVSSGDYKTVERSLLEVECDNKSYLALNDFVIQRATSGTNFSNTVDLRADIDGSTVDNFSADGIIVSTPTGSTAYSLSAGGSILTPDINAFIMTPICAHSLHSRPVVYSDDSVLEIFPTGKTPLNIVVDGRVVGVICEKSTVKIKKSKYKVSFITRDEKNFFKKLIIKLNIWSK
jgi:NAD+ kinase